MRKFDELTDKEKQKAREEHTSDGYLDYEWCDCVYEDVVRMAALLGIDITEDRKRHHIYFSGFNCQGSGASFSAVYRMEPTAVQDIQRETTDEELLRIATELTAMQVEQRMQNLEPFRASVYESLQGYSVSVEIKDAGTDEVGEPDEDRFCELMNDFAAWIYEQLEAEHDWLYSDECVDEQLRDQEFEDAEEEYES